MRKRLFSRKKHDEENPYWMSFSDMMSALLMVFILASIILILQLIERQKEFESHVADFEVQVLHFEHQMVSFNNEIEGLKRAEETRKTILIEVAEALEKEGIHVDVSENHTVLRIPNELLGFDTGAFDILPRYEATAKKIGETIFKIIHLEGRKDYLDTIFIEGHTDNRPLQGLMGKGNWGLSTFRSISLWQFWASNLPEELRLDTIKNHDGAPLFSVSGYGETRPVIEDQVTESDFKKNRRIDIRFTIRRPESEDYEQIKAKFKGEI